MSPPVGKLVREEVDGATPRLPGYRPVQPSFLPDVAAGVVHCSLGGLDHVGDGQVFHPDDGEGVGEFGGGLVLPVAGSARGCCAEPGDLAVGTGEAAAGRLTGLAGAAPARCGLLQAAQPLTLARGEPRLVVAVGAVGQGERDGDAPVDADQATRRLRRRRVRREFGTEDDVPAVGFLDQPRPGHPTGRSGAGGAGEVLGPAEPDDPDLRDTDLPPAPGQALDLQVPALRHVHRHARADTRLEVRRIRPGLPAVDPRPVVRLQHLLCGLRRKRGQPRYLLARLADVLVGERQGSASHGAPTSHRPPVVQRVPQEPCRMSLAVQGDGLFQGQVQQCLVPALTLQQIHPLRLDFGRSYYARYPWRHAW